MRRSTNLVCLRGVLGLVFGLSLAFTSKSTASDAWTLLLHEDFESGLDSSWSLDSGWSVADDSGNMVLTGSDSSCADHVSADTWTDYTIRLRVKVTVGGFNVNVRKSSVGRYAITLQADAESLIFREFPWGNTAEVDFSPTTLSTGGWHEIEIALLGPQITVKIDGTLIMDYTDGVPLTYGDIAFESFLGATVFVDEILITGTPPPQSLIWEKVGGPIGGLGYDLPINLSNPDVIYVTDNFSGVSKSVDGGNTWAESNTGITTRGGSSGDAIPVFCAEIDPNDANTIWAGTSGTRGIFKSTNGGATWARYDNGISEETGITLRSITVDPNNSSVVYAGAEIHTVEQGIEFSKQKGKIYKTTNAGANWSEVWAGDALIRHIIVDPGNSNIVYAGSGIFDREAFNSDLANNVPGGIGVLKSTDAGANWTQKNSGLGNLYVGYLLMHPTDSSILYAATGNNATSAKGFLGGLFVTTDGAATWTAAIPNQYGVNSVAIAPSNTAIRYAGASYGFWRSSNSGISWAFINVQGPPGLKAGFPIDLQVDPDDPNHIYTNNYGGGVFQSFDGGTSWVESSSGFTGADLRAVTVSQSNLSKVYAVGRSGPFKTTDAGDSWIGMAFGPVTEFGWYAIEVSPDDENLVIMGSEQDGSLYRTTDGGVTWTRTFNHPDVDENVAAERQGFKAIAIAPSNSSIIYAGMCLENPRIEREENNLSHGIYISTDGGLTWAQRISGMSGVSNLNIHDIAVHPTNSSIVYVATNDQGVFKSVDAGATWVQKISGLPDLAPDLDTRSLAISPSNGNVIYVGLQGNGVYKSADAGSSWSYISTGLDAWAIIHTIDIHPSNSNIVVVGDNSFGVFSTATGTEPWTAVNTGLLMRSVRDLRYSAGGGVLYAASAGGGLFRAYPDVDGDGLRDIEEDLDDDGVIDPGETDPNDTDTDNDGFSDYYETEFAAQGGDPSDATKTPSLTDIWVDFSYLGPELGTQIQPDNTLGEGVAHVASGGAVRIKGDNPLPNTDEAFSVNKNTTLNAIGGPVKLGTGIQP